MECTKEAIWLRHLLSELQLIKSTATEIFVDNQSTIKLVHNPVFHQRTKHFELHYHFSREKFEEGVIAVSHVSSKEMPADIFTKPLSRVKFEECRNRLGVTSLPAL
jgi:hypothetical protein